MNLKTWLIGVILELRAPCARELELLGWSSSVDEFTYRFIARDDERLESAGAIWIWQRETALHGPYEEEEWHCDCIWPTPSCRLTG